MPLLFKSTHLIDDSQPYCYGRLELLDVDNSVYFMQFTLRATSAATADAAIRAIAIALESLTQLKIKSVEAVVMWDNIQGDNPVPAYGNQRENQGIITTVLTSQKEIELPIPNPTAALLDPFNRKYLNLNQPALAAFLAHLQSGKILVKGQIPLFYLRGHICHVKSGQGNEVFLL